MSTPLPPVDERFMAAAIALAARGLGTTAPNPAVGALIVQHRSLMGASGKGAASSPSQSTVHSPAQVVGRGWTKPGGRPHAEAVALAQAGADARNATCYVTLEPCSHHGKSPPCAQALVAAGIGRVVIGCGDPDPRVAGRGIETLRQAGISVSVGVLGEAARRVTAGFLSRVEQGRPLVTLKLATSADGRSATASGHSQWITGPEARAHAHAERARHDAIMVGADTVIADDPVLTCRLPGLAMRSPIRIVVDRRARIPATARLLTDHSAPTVIVTGPEGGKSHRAALMSPPAGVTGTVEVMALPEIQQDDGDLDLILTALGARGITRLLVESGGRLAAALIKRHLVDRVDWYRSPSILGGDGLAAIGALALDRADQAIGLIPIDRRTLGADGLDRFEIRH